MHALDIKFEFIFLMSPFCGQKGELKEISNLSKVLVAQWRLNQDL